MSAQHKGRVIVTCGPSYEPIDEVRRITNHSTGKLGHQLSNRLAIGGWDVLCFKGAGATHHAPVEASVERVPFGTNDHLLERLLNVPEREKIVAVFHAAALCDFKVKALADAHATAVGGPKISSRAGELTLTLEPAKKIIGELRALFPQARIIGWKYELSGTREEALAKGERQIAENRTDLCVVNGRAYGSGFGVVEGRRLIAELADNEALCGWLYGWLEGSGGVDSSSSS
jgi:phosphopantothenoylcysteine synthetase/decarboxylase